LYDAARQAESAGRDDTLLPIRAFFIAAFALTWGIGGIAVLAGRWLPGRELLAPSSPLYYGAAYAVSVAGILCTARYSGRPGLRDLAARCAPWRASTVWCLVVAVGYFVMTAAAIVAAGSFRATQISPSWALAGGVLLSIVKDPGPLGEEFGWRGFALPQLLRRRPPLAAALILGLVHAAWHLPLFFIPDMPQAHISLPLFTLGVVSISVFTTALHLRRGADLFLAIMVHWLSNVGGAFAASAGALHHFFVAEAIMAVLVVAAGGLRPSEPRPAGIARHAPPHTQTSSGPAARVDVFRRFLKPWGGLFDTWQSAARR
jgi:membrane protease YdiL (CAAX protease family)